MVRCFVDQKGPAVLALAVPAAKVRGPVIGVEVPVKVDGRHLADRALVEQLPDPRHVRAPSVVEPDNEVVVGAAFGVEDGLALFLVDRHGLFGKHVASHLQALDDEPMVRGVRRRHDHQIGIFLPHHRLEVGVRVARHPHVVLSEVQSTRIVITEPHKFQQVPVPVYQISAPESDAPNAGADQGNLEFAVREKTQGRGGDPRSCSQHADRSKKMSAGLSRRHGFRGGSATDRKERFELHLFYKNMETWSTSR